MTEKKKRQYHAILLICAWAAAFQLPPSHAQVRSEFDQGCDVPLDLRAPGEAMEHVQVRDQAQESHCYAEVASQLVDAWRFSHSDFNYPHQTSGIALALETNSDLFGTGIARPDGSFTGGWSCLAVDTARRQGSCDRRAVLERLGGGSVTDSIAFLRRYYDEYHAWRDTRSAARIGIESLAATGPTPGQTVACRLSDELLARHVPNEIRPSYQAILALLDESNPLLYLQGMMTQACESRHVVSVSTIPSCEPSVFTSASDAYRTLAARLRATRAPLAIGYCGRLLTQGRSLNTGTFGALPAAARAAQSSTCGNHESLVIGLRRNTRSGRCQFLIRNSWGEGCSNYSSDWQCERGNVWIDAESLSQNTWGMSDLSP